MMSGLAVLPALGGTLFVAILLAAQFADVKVQRAESMGRRVLPRPWSIVSDDPRTRGHWLTLAAACIFATTVPATSIWQNKAIAGANDAAMTISASIAASSFFLMALVPHRDSRSATSVTFSAVWHFITAGCFLAAGTVHATRVAIFALESRAIFIARVILVGVMSVCVLAMVFGVLHLYVISAKVFNMHYYPASGAEPCLSKLSEEEDIQLRKKMMVLFLLQAFWGLCYGVLIVTCADEVRHLKGDEADTGGIVMGSTFAATFVISIVAYMKHRHLH